MSDDFEDLSARARRGSLSGSEPARLDALLEGSAEARQWHAAGAEFDAEGAVLPGDHAAAERVARRILARLPQNRARSRRRIALASSAAVLFVAFVAVAAVVVRNRPQGKLPAPSAVGNVNAPHTRASVSPTAEASAILAPAVAPAVAPTPSVRPPTAALGASATQPVESAASLFSAAAKARREGNASQAVLLLDGLQSRYPSSPEAQASDITLGMLQLKRGAASAALPHFQKYRRHSPSAALAPEALWGEAQAFAALGRRADSRLALTTLLTRFPDSTYASAARAKLNAEPSDP